MLIAPLRPMALACLTFFTASYAQQSDGQTARLGTSPGEIYEKSRQDVTIPLATESEDGALEAASVTIPLENLATPMRCMAAWSYLAASAIRDPDTSKQRHPDFSEATASAHWQHWLSLDLEQHQGALSEDFHQRRLAAERDFSTELNDEGDLQAYRTLGTCYVDPSEWQIADPTILLRNFMIEHQGLPDEFAVPVLQRQLRAFPISESIEADTETSCDEQAEALAEDVRLLIVNACFERGGILASQPKAVFEDTGETCRATGTVQCENIP